MTRRRAFAVVLGIGCLAQTAGAHVTSTSYSTVELGRDAVRIHLLLNANQLRDAGLLDLNGDGQLGREEIQSALNRVRANVEREFFLRINGFSRPVPALLSARVDEGDWVILDYEVALPQPTERVEVHASLERLTDPHHQHLMRVTDGGTTRQYAFDHGSDEARIDTPATGLWMRGIDFVRLGIFHIFTGYDHLLFLTGLLVATVSLSQLVRVVTAFTVAHSLTLVLATLGLIVLPTRFVESAIALTIAYVAVENFWRRSMDNRWRLTFFFGLVHGFGFSNVLRQLALPRGTLALSLFSFNLGVEIGQLAFVALAFPLLSWMSHSRAYAGARVAVSTMGLVFGAYWFVTRAFFG